MVTQSSQECDDGMSIGKIKFKDAHMEEEFEISIQLTGEEIVLLDVFRDLT